MKANNIYEVNPQPNNGCLRAVILLIICIVFGYLTSCTKDQCVHPVFPVDKSKLCMGCEPSTLVDTTVRKQF